MPRRASRWGRLHADRGEWRDAEQQCLLALEQDALCIAAHHLLGQIHEHQGQLDAALAAYRRVLYLDRHFVPAMLGIAGVWSELGQAANAWRTYRNALSHLSALPAAALIPGGEGATAGELLALARQQLALLG